MLDFNIRSNHIRSNFSMCDSITLNKLHATYCNSLYGCELLNFKCSYISKIYVAWRKAVRRIFRLPPRAHNYIVSQLRNCIVVKLDRRLGKFLYTLLHSYNIVVSSMVLHKLHCSSSVLAENYRYLAFKYKLCHDDWYHGLNHLMSKLINIYSAEETANYKIVAELCSIRDGEHYCDSNITRDNLCNMIDLICLN